MWIHILSDGKLLSLVPACLAFQNRRMIYEIKMVCSLFHLRYILTMRMHLLLEYKLVLSGRLRISMQEWSVKLNWSVLFSTCGISWPCAFVYSKRVSYFSLVHAWLAFQQRRMISEIKWSLSFPLAVLPDHVHSFTLSWWVIFSWFIHV